MPLNDLFADIPSEGASEAFGSEKEEQAKETPAESQTENKPVEEQAPASEGAEEKSNTPDENNLPFHKHPRWKETYEKAKKVDDLEAELAELKRQQGEMARQVAPSSQEVPERFKRLYGDNPEAWALYREEMEAWKREAIETIKAEREQESRVESEKDRAAHDFIDSQLESLREEGLKFDENKLMQFALEWQTSDEQGNVDLHKAYTLMSKLDAAESATKSRAKKDIASLSSGSSMSSEASQKDYVTAADLRNKGWDDLVR